MARSRSLRGHCTWLVRVYLGRAILRSVHANIRINYSWSFPPGAALSQFETAGT